MILAAIWWAISVFVRVLLAWAFFGGSMLYLSWLLQPEQFTLTPDNPIRYLKRLMILGILFYVFQFILPT